MYRHSEPLSIFSFNDTATTEIYTLSLHDALPISAAPIALVLLALVGTLWSDAAWGARFYAVNPTIKLLVLPVLLYHFERSPRGRWIFIAFLVSCALLSVMSWLVAFYPDLSLKSDHIERGIFVKNYIDQSQEFTLCE